MATATMSGSFAKDIVSKHLRNVISGNDPEFLVWLELREVIKTGSPEEQLAAEYLIKKYQNNPQRMIDSELFTQLARGGNGHGSSSQSQVGQPRKYLESSTS